MVRFWGGCGLQCSSRHIHDRNASSGSLLQLEIQIPLDYSAKLALLNTLKLALLLCLLSSFLTLLKLFDHLLVHLVVFLFASTLPLPLISFYRELSLPSWP